MDLAGHSLASRHLLNVGHSAGNPDFSIQLQRRVLLQFLNHVDIAIRGDAAFNAGMNGNSDKKGRVGHVAEVRRIDTANR